MSVTLPVARVLTARRAMTGAIFIRLAAATVWRVSIRPKKNLSLCEFCRLPLSSLRTERLGRCFGSRKT